MGRGRYPISEMLKCKKKKVSVRIKKCRTILLESYLYTVRNCFKSLNGEAENRE